MPLHWTYAHFEHDEDLQQGDLVRRSDDLLSLLSDVHKFFCDQRYVAFAVLTQSCDLVRRSERCKAEHIQLAVVRELEPLLPRILEEDCGAGVPGVFKEESRYIAMQIVQKIINQNDQARALFYLHPDVDAGIATAAVVMLRISIALRRHHYDTLVQSRCGRLSTEYANKLGWLSGNLYSRVATPDWEDKESDKHASEKLARKYLEWITEGNRENWVPAAWIRAAEAHGLDLDEVSAQAFASTLKPYAPEPPMEIALNRMKSVSEGVVAQHLADIAIKRLEELHDLVVQQITSLGAGALSSDDCTRLGEKLRNDEDFGLAIRNYATLLVTKHLTTAEASSIDDACRGLAALRGIGQGRARLQHHVEELVKGQAEVAKRFMDSVGGTRLFSSDAVSAVKQELTTTFTNEHTNLIDKVLKRLRNDQQFTSVFRQLRRSVDG